MTTRITAADILQFRVFSPTRIEIELRNPIEAAFFDLHFDLQICGASTLAHAPMSTGSAPIEIDFKNSNS